MSRVTESELCRAAHLELRDGSHNFSLRRGLKAFLSEYAAGGRCCRIFGQRCTVFPPISRVLGRAINKINDLGSMAQGLQTYKGITKNYAASSSARYISGQKLNQIFDSMRVSDPRTTGNDNNESSL